MPTPQERGHIMRSSQPPVEVEEYLSNFPMDFQKALLNIRSIVLRVAPSASEAFVYGVPGFKMKGKSLVCYAAFKNHCGFYPMNPELIKEFARELSVFETAKGTIRFQPDHPIPDPLLKKMVTARVKELGG